MYDKEQMRSKVLELLKENSQDEIKNIKQENFERAISIALDEIDEFERFFNQFMDDVKHLEVFQHAIKEPLEQDIYKITSHLKYLIEKSYTKEETEKMPETVFEQVRVSQERRIDLLRRVAKRYLSRPKSD